jgi:hypothetical protein
MLLARSFTGSVPLLAYQIGTFTVVFVVFGAALAAYAVYWMIFKVGKD